LTRSKSAATAAGSRISVATTRVRGAGAWAMAAVSSSISRRRPASTTFQPSSSRACAVARPMPLPAPVITAIFAAWTMSQFLFLKLLTPDRPARRDKLLLRGDERQFAAARAHGRFDHPIDRGDRCAQRVRNRLALEQPAQKKGGRRVAATGRFDRQTR